MGGEFSWVYIDRDTYMSASGPTGSIQFRTGDETIDGFRYTTLTGSSRFVYVTSSNSLQFHGDINITGNLNIDGSLISLSSSNLIIQDPAIGLAFGTGSAHTGAVGDRGFVFGIAGNNNQALIWDQTSGSFLIGKVGATGPTQTAFDIPFGDLSTLRLSALQFIQDLSGSGRLFGFGIETSGHLGVSGSIKNGSFVSSSGEIYGTNLRTSGQTALSGTLITSGNVHLGDNKKLYFGANEVAFIEYDETSRDVLSISGSLARGIELSGSAIFVDAISVTSGNIAGPNSYISLASDRKLVLTDASTGVPGGNNTNIQFNNGGVFGGSDGFTIGSFLGGAGGTYIKLTGSISGSGEVKAGSLSTSGEFTLTGSLSSSGEIFGTSLLTSNTVQVSGTIKNKAFISSSGEIFATNGLRTSGLIAASGALTAGPITTLSHFTEASSLGSLNVGDLSGSGRLFGQGIETSGHLGVSGSIRNSSFISSSGEIFGASLRTSAGVQVSGTIKNNTIVSSSAEVSGESLRTSGIVLVTGSIKTLSFVSSSATVFGQSLVTSGDLLASGTIKNSSFISASGEVFAAGGLRTSGPLSVTGSTLLKGETLIQDDLIVENSVRLTGSLTVMSGTVPVFETDGEEHDGTGVLQGRSRGRFLQMQSFAWAVTSTDFAEAGRFLPMSNNTNGTVASSTSIASTAVQPFAGRLVKVIYKCPGSNDGTPPQLQFWAGHVNEQNGVPVGDLDGGGSTSFIIQAQATASGPGNNPAAGHPGQNIVGEFDLTSDFQATGSFSFGTGSLVAIELLIPGGASSFGYANVTTVFEYDTFNEYFTGSGN